MEKLIGFYRWGNWIVLLGNGKTLAVTRPKNLIVKIERMEGLKFKGEEKSLVTVTGSENEIKRFINALGGTYLAELP